MFLTGAALETVTYSIRISVRLMVVVTIEMKTGKRTTETTRVIEKDNALVASSLSKGRAHVARFSKHGIRMMYYVFGSTEEW